MMKYGFSKEELPGTLEKVVEVLIPFSDLDRAILFGSCARGTATGSSDVDLLFVHRPVLSPHEWFMMAEAINAGLEEAGIRTGNEYGRVHITWADQAKFSEIPSDFYDNIRAEGRVLFKRGEDGASFI